MSSLAALLCALVSAVVIPPYRYAAASPRCACAVSCSSPRASYTHDAGQISSSTRLAGLLLPQTESGKSRSVARCVALARPGQRGPVREIQGTRLFGVHLDESTSAHPRPIKGPSRCLLPDKELCTRSCVCHSQIQTPSRKSVGVAAGVRAEAPAPGSTC